MVTHGIEIKNLKQPSERYVRDQLSRYRQLSFISNIARPDVHDHNVAMTASYREVLEDFLGQEQVVERLDVSELMWYDDDFTPDPIPRFTAAILHEMVRRLKRNQTEMLEISLVNGRLYRPNQKDKNGEVIKMPIPGIKELLMVSRLQDLLDECGQDKLGEQIKTESTDKFVKGYERFLVTGGKR